MASILISIDKGVTYKNIYTEYHALPVKGFYEALLTPPGVKEPIVNECRLCNGSQVIIAPNSVKLKKRDVILSFVISGNTVSEYMNLYKEFIKFISSGEIWMKVEKLNTIYRLVYSECQRYNDFGAKLGKFALKFTEYNPANRPNETESV